MRIRKEFFIARIQPAFSMHFKKKCAERECPLSGMQYPQYDFEREESGGNEGGRAVFGSVLSFCLRAEMAVFFFVPQGKTLAA